MQTLSGPASTAPIRFLTSLAARRPLLIGALTLFVLLSLVYSFSVGLRATRGASITGDEPFYLLTTQSLLQDGNLNLAEQYAARSYESFFDHPAGLWQQSIYDENGVILSPHDPGLSVLVLPGFALDGLRGAQVQLLLLAAATFALAYVLAAAETKAPLLSWLTTLAVGLTATSFVYATEIYPEMPAAFCVVLSLLLLRFTGRGAAAGVALIVLLSALAWLGIKYVPLGLLIGAAFLLGAGWRSRAVFVGLGALSGLVYVWAHYAIFGDLMPYSINTVHEGAPAADVIQAHIAFEDRVYRLWGLFIDRRFGIGHWAPLFLLVLPALPIAIRRTRFGLLATGLILTQMLIATFVAITMMGWWFSGRTLVAVLPLMPLVLTALLVSLPAVLRLAAGALGAWSALTTAALAQAVSNGEVTLAVDPFDMRSRVFQVTSRLFPDYRFWDQETFILTAVWLAIGGVAIIATTLRAGWVLPALRLTPFGRQQTVGQDRTLP